MEEFAKDATPWYFEWPWEKSSTNVNAIKTNKILPNDDSGNRAPTDWGYNGAPTDWGPSTVREIDDDILWLRMYIQID